jgi:hypothetical protein
MAENLRRLKRTYQAGVAPVLNGKPRDRFSEVNDFAADRLQKSGDDVEQRAFARAVGTYQTGQRTLFNGESDAL